jgi:DMSO/TMAO reductase YedYZ heme-binding membrane subunit
MASSSREARRRRGLLYLILVGLVSLIVVGILIALKPVGGRLDWAIRAAAMLGYLAIFLAVISSAYMRQLFKLFGRPFIRMHHILSVSGLILVTLHPLGIAVRGSQLSVFVPNVSSLDAFLRLGGRPAWYLIGIAALAAVLRTRIKKSWRAVHYLNYVAFLLATAHAVMIGTDFISSPVMKAVAIAMALAVVAVFATKRIRRRRRTRRK